MTEEKSQFTKLVIKIAKNISIFFTVFFVSAITAAACVIFTKKSQPRNVEAASKVKIIQQCVNLTETESQEKTFPGKFESTMSRMISGKETAKGDRAVELEEIARKKAHERKKSAKEKRRRLINKHKKHYSSSNLELMAHLIYGEAGDQDDKCQQAVGMVVINRANDTSFKQDTVKDVIFSPGQYACTKDGNFDKTPSKQAYKNAKAVLTGNTIIDVPEDVVYQAQFTQGSAVWKKLGTETFCRK